ncbi:MULTISPECIES: porin family protein [Rhodanobacter]|uniref:porin family protein n=1 Tax=Rhodanobacter TaxID=75309 RepID=UPI0004044AA2|nr:MULTISPECIES: porin family protein [Rhodanobacter]KZC19741.1 autotransporter [Rhodanobacter denitrificans]UJJ51626.1 porin family protein [Rhodanobacter denitrificans]UJJ59595.1 porin family protein [Rhodanobacter denitrificans]UJM94370.1 porin family protein [Rhodanobacter denitrificans]UJM97900.1 porin family protein [Rhodanobacter denitrificans]
MKMNKTLLALAFASAGLLAIPAAFAQSAPTHNDGWFINGNVGQASLNHGPYDDSTTGYGINGGYRWALNPSLALGAEVGYNDLGNIHPKNVFNSQPVVDRGKSQLHGWTAGVNGHFNVSPNWYVSARTGIYGWKGHGLSNDVNPVRKGLDNTSWYAGAGVGYDFSNNVSVGLNYDYYDAKKDRVNLSTDMVSVSAEYRF